MEYLDVDIGHNVIRLVKSGVMIVLTKQQADELAKLITHRWKPDHASRIR